MLSLLKKYNLNKSTPLIISLSGGVDSMVLATLLANNNYNLIIVHFNHNTRKSNLDDQNLVKNFAENNNLPFYIFSINIKKGNFQNEARKKRYEKLIEIAKKHETKYILTAHHLDDLAESVLMKISRGSSLNGYSGINEISYKDDCLHFKPLLYTSKAQIKLYALKNNVVYNEDETNFSNNYSRNRYRNNIIPVLKDENPSFLEKIRQFNEILITSSKFIRNTALKFYREKINVAEFIKFDPAIQNEIISLHFEAKKIEFNIDILNTIKKILLSKTPNQEYNLKGGFIFVKSYNDAYITKKTAPEKFNFIIKDKSITLPNNDKITISTNKAILNPKSLKLCYNEMNLPLIIRSRTNGDTLNFSFGKKKLKDLLIDLKMPKTKRENLIILTDSSNTILWVSDVYLNKTLGNKNKLHFLWEKNENEQHD